MRFSEVVITGVGVVSPIGIGRGPFWNALLHGQSGIVPATITDLSGLAPQVVGQVPGFDAKSFVINRKSLKVMARDAQLGVAAGVLACRDAGVAAGSIDADRFGVVFGADQICAPIEESRIAYGPCIVEGRFDFNLWGTKAIENSYPLGFLRVLPNMIASHVSISQDARGPNNTIHQGELSSMLSVVEAASVIQRGMADIMLAGGASSQMHVHDFLRRQAMGFVSPRYDNLAAISRPFDKYRDGQVWSEGAAALVLESRHHAEARGAKILARIKGWGVTFGPTDIQGKGPRFASSLHRAMRLAMDRAGISPAGLGHINAHGLSTQTSDAIEARTICEFVPTPPVTALKSYFGNLGAAGAAMELIGSVLAVEQGLVPATLNYESPDPACPVEIICREPLARPSTDALCITWMPIGQSAALILGPA